MMMEFVTVWKSKYFYFRHIAAVSAITFPWLYLWVSAEDVSILITGSVLYLCMNSPVIYSLRVPVLRVLDNKIKINHMYWFESVMDITDELKVSYGPDEVYFRSDGKEISLQRRDFNPKRWEEITGELKECLGQ